MTAVIKTTQKKDLVPGSRIPIAYLLDYFRDGFSISDFLASYPWIKRIKVEKALEEIKKREFVAHNAL